MATLVKVKVTGIALFAIIFAASFVFYQITNTPKTNRLKQWSPDSTLYLNDFKRTPDFFNSDYSATISTGIKADQIADGEYYAYAVIDRYKSSFDENDYSDYLLNHEKYHANIASVAAIELNDILDERTISSQDEISSWMTTFHERKNRLDHQYDKETNHSLNRPHQFYWEYKIDSMYYRHLDLEREDLFSGISCYFPSPPDVQTWIDTFLVRKQYLLEKYNMRLRYITDYDCYIDTAVYHEGFTNHLTNNGFINITTKGSTSDSTYIIESSCDDTSTNRKFVDRIIYSKPFLYQLTVSYPLKTENDTFYKRMKDQFLNSVDISDNEKYWIRISDNRKHDLKRADVINKEKKDYNILCTKSNSNYSIIYHKPIFHNEKITIPFQSVRHDFQEMDKLVLIVNNKYIFSQTPDSLYQIITLNRNEYGINDINRLQFGYTLKKDSTKNCYYLNGSVYQ